LAYLHRKVFLAQPYTPQGGAYLLAFRETVPADTIPLKNKKATGRGRTDSFFVEKHLDSESAPGSS